MNDLKGARLRSYHYAESKDSGADDGHHELDLGLGRPSIPTNIDQVRTDRNRSVNLTIVPLGR